MIRGMYSSATALDASIQRQEVIAENLAHLSTPGYRGRGIRFTPFEEVLSQHAADPPDRLGVEAAGFYTDFRAGAFRQTGNPHHLAIEGDSFFALQGPNGTLYTRNGSFHRGADGQLLSDGNYPVLGTNGPITLPADAGRISIARDGSVSADGIPVGNLQLTKFADKSRLVRVGPTLFEAPADAGEQPGEGSVIQGVLESSNITPASAMIELIQASRYFEAAQRALRSMSDTLQQNTRPSA